jgi:hypothetical protein
MGNKEKVWKFKRYVVGPNAERKSCILSNKATNVVEEPGYFHRADLWCTSEMPVDNAIAADRSLLSKTREPLPGGTVFRALELQPDSADRHQHREIVEKLHHMVGAKHMPSEEDYEKHPNMHRTDTVDYLTCVLGEVWLMTDVDEVLMKPGDTVVIRGTNHAWSNRSDKPCLLVGALIDAKPWP